jgi:hypothetical protein
MRVFGTPANHPARLEQHPGLSTGGGTDWFVVVFSVSPLGVARYQILDAAHPTRCLGVAAGDTALSLLDNAFDPATSAWYLLPASSPGWDLVHAGTGQRVESNTAGQLTLSPLLAGNTYFDIWRHGTTQATHRSHFWLPPFFPRYGSTVPFRSQPGTHRHAAPSHSGGRHGGGGGYAADGHARAETGGAEPQD